MTPDLRTLVERLKAVSHPLRLRTLALLASGELCVCQVAEVLEVPLSSASEALRDLRRAGFVTERREGRWVYVSVVPEAGASSLLKGLIEEAGRLPEAAEDLRRARDIRALEVPVVCSRVQGASSRTRKPALP